MMPKIKQFGPYQIAKVNDSLSQIFAIKIGQNPLQSRLHKIKEGENYQNAVKEINDSAKKAIESNSSNIPFNGEKLVFYFKDQVNYQENNNLSKDNEKSQLKVLDSDYATFRATIGNPDSQYKHFPTGVIVAVVTLDNKIIIGSRDANRDKNNSTIYPLQMPCGFIDLDKKENDINKLIVDNAIREVQEELYGDAEFLDCEIVGLISQTKNWYGKPEKYTDSKKQVNNIKSFIVACYVKQTYEEIKENRNSKNTKDIHELSQISSFDIDIKNLEALDYSNVKFNLDFDGKERNFVAEHSAALYLAINNEIEKLQEKDLKNMVDNPSCYKAKEKQLEKI